MHPARSWRELVATTTTLYEQARASRLGTEKFMLDGRHTGTGGGNHLVLGGPTPADSPFLRRPDLLRSFVGYWLNHPSLSYLFSGVFIGPTSQAPRVDETRADAVYELEIAMSLLDGARGVTPGAPPYVPPWLVDRIFRNLLVDVTGNTHRAEFCIDKLYSPDGATGRLGLVEMRAFEMPPHARMSLAQQLLVRTLLAWFWRDPYKVAPIRWGTRLHDRFLLPYYVERDFAAVRRRTAARRLPDRSRVVRAARGVPLSGVRPRGLRRRGRSSCARRSSRGTCWAKSRAPAAPRATWTPRWSGCRCGCAASSPSASRSRATVCSCRCSRRAPRASSCAACATAPGSRRAACTPRFPCTRRSSLTSWTPRARRAIGGCTYHVAHPGGRNYATVPVNSNEAEARRRARFFGFGHTPGSPLTLVMHENREFPVHARSAAPARPRQS